MRINLTGVVDAWMLQDLEFMLDYIAGKNEDIDIIVNSLGGSVVAGKSIYSRLKRHEGKTRAFIDGFAGSMMSLIPLACDEVIMTGSGVVMIHDPLITVNDNKKGLEITIEMLQKVKDSMVAVYMERFNKTEQEIIDMMERETWLNAEEAVAIGFADRFENETDLKNNEKTILSNESTENYIVAQLTDFKNIPQDIKNKYDLTGTQNAVKNENTIGGLKSMSNTKDELTGASAEDPKAQALKIEDAKAEGENLAQNRIKSILNVFAENGLTGHAKMNDLLMDAKAGELEAYKACTEILKAEALTAKSEAESVKTEANSKTSLADKELEKMKADAEDLDLVGGEADTSSMDAGSLDISAFSEGFNSVGASDFGGK